MVFLYYNACNCSLTTNVNIDLYTLSNVKIPLLTPTPTQLGVCMCVKLPHTDPNLLPSNYSYKAYVETE